MGLCGGKLTTNHLSHGMTTNLNTNFCTNPDYQYTKSKGMAKRQNYNRSYGSEWFG
jgi:hypothetical protein